MKPVDYWKECISNAAEEIGLSLTTEQLTSLAEAVETGHECYGQAFYSPPSNDRFSELERQHKQQLAAKDREMEAYRSNAETAIKQALHVHRDDNVSIGEYGEVLRHGGRTERLQ